MWARRLAVRCWMILAVAALAAGGCNTAQRDWEAAQQEGTIEAYELFVQEHPDAEQASEARDLLPKLREEKAWREAKERNTIAAYTEFRSEYPQSGHAEEAEAATDALRFKQARAEDAIEAYESYLRQHPDGRGVEHAEKRLRALRYRLAVDKGTVAALESFLERYPEGQDADKLRALLPQARRLEKSLALAKAIMKLAPRTTMRVENFRVTGKETVQKEITPEVLAEIRSRLAEGADPALVRIAGFEPPGEKRLGGGAVLHSTGRPGRAVRAGKGGMTLQQYCRANKLDAIAELLAEAESE